MKLRRFLFHVHLYMGLIAGLLLSVAGLTGSLLVFSHELDALLYPRLHHAAHRGGSGESKGPHAVLEAVRRAYPATPVQYLLPPREQDGVYEVWLKGDRRVYIDPHSGALLGSRRTTDHPAGFVLALHTHLLAGDAGETVVGLGGVLLILLGVTGVYLWWPGKRNLRQGFKVQWRASWKRVNYDLHRVGGILAVLLLGLIALTGTALVFGAFFTDAAHWLTRTPRPPARPLSVIQTGVPPLPLDDLIQRADDALPGGVTTRITPPTRPEAAVIVRKKLPGDLHPNGMSFDYLDQYSGAPLRVENALLAPAAPRLLNLRYPLHIGSYGGIASRLLHLLVGLTPGTLFVTGCLMWWNRKSGRTRRSRGRAARGERADPEPAYRGGD